MRIANSTFEKFLVKWRTALRAPTDLWDGYQAIEELKQADYPIEPRSTDVHAGRSMLHFLRCERGCGWRPRDMLDRVLREVRDYKRQRFAWEKQVKDTEMFLAGLARKAKRRSLNATDSRIKALLKDTYEAIENQRTYLANYCKSPGRSPLGAWEGLWERNPRIETIHRGITLHTRLQLQSAKMFRIYLRAEGGVSLRTVARLIVLVYQLTGLAVEEEKDGRLWICDLQRPITWRTVEDNLRRHDLR